MSSYPPSTGEGITANMVQALGQTKPWVRFLSILGFVGAGFMVLAALFLMVAGGMGGMGRGPFGGAQGLILGAVYLLMALVYVPPSLFLFRYASAIAVIRPGSEAHGMERALEAQKSFWRYVGITALIVLCLYVLAIGAAIVVGVVASMR